MPRQDADVSRLLIQLKNLRMRPDARALKEALPKLREWCKKESQYVIRSGGVKVILDSLRNFPSDAGVQAIACATLGTLAYNSLHYPESKELIGLSYGTDGKRGVDLVVRAMHAFPSNADVQGECCWALSHICGNCAPNAVAI